MTSETRRAANRRNAARSTGPRSAAGKKRASQNALCHGLAISLGQDAETRAEIERMARVAITERAMNAARVRADQGQPRAHPGRGAGPDAPATAGPTDIEALRQALPQLARLERYVTLVLTR